jgi:hypothetical protein
VTAQTQDSIFVYSTIGGTISADGTALTGGNTYKYNDGSTVTFIATPDSGYQFLSWVDLTAAGGTTNTTTPLQYNVSASGAIEALFIPTSNATAAPGGTGTSTVVIMLSAGGTTEPLAGSYTNYTVGNVSSFTAVPGNGFKFLYWMIAPSTSNTFTTSQVSWNVTADVCALQAYFVPTSSTVALPSASASPTASPTVPEFSGIATVIIALALVAVAFGTYTYRRKAKQ